MVLNPTENVGNTRLSPYMHQSICSLLADKKSKMEDAVC